MSQDDAVVSEVLAANLGFYDAFGSLDIEKMDSVWEDSHRVMCIHPGWRLITGWDEVRKSWEGIFRNTSLMHFNITGAQVIVQGTAPGSPAWRTSPAWLMRVHRTSRSRQPTCLCVGRIAGGWCTTTPRREMLSSFHYAPATSLGHLIVW